MAARRSNDGFDSPPRIHDRYLAGLGDRGGLPGPAERSLGKWGGLFDAGPQTVARSCRFAEGQPFETRAKYTPATPNITVHSTDVTYEKTTKNCTQSRSAWPKFLYRYTPKVPR